jgi:hypothetical protein
VNAEIEVRRLADGRLQARRLDGRPLTDEDRELARQLAIQNPNKTDIAEGFRHRRPYRLAYRRAPLVCLR